MDYSGNRIEIYLKAGLATLCRVSSREHARIRLNLAEPVEPGDIHKFNTFHLRRLFL
jgi:hypothetical protein